MVGSGILLFPYCFNAGIFISIGLSAFFCFFSGLALINFIEAGATANQYDFDGLFSYVFPQDMFGLFMLQFLMLHGVLLQSTVIFLDNLLHLLFNQAKYMVSECSGL
jgi:hypothetical protein